MSEIAAAKYVRLTTYTRDDQPKYTPVWIVDLGDGRIGTTTDDDSWKIKRLRNNPQDFSFDSQDSRQNPLRHCDNA